MLQTNISVKTVNSIHHYALNEEKVYNDGIMAIGNNKLMSTMYKWFITLLFPCILYVHNVIIWFCRA